MHELPPTDADLRKSRRRTLSPTLQTYTLRDGRQLLSFKDSSHKGDHFFLTQIFIPKSLQKRLKRHHER